MDEIFILSGFVAFGMVIWLLIRAEIEARKNLKKMNRTDNEVIAFFKENENDMYKLKSIYTELVKTQRYYLAKLYKNKIEILEHLEKFEIENNLKKIFMDEGLKRASQNNFNQAEAGYNAKWFKRGAIFGYEKAKEENKDLIDVFEKMLNCLEQANFYQRKPDLIIQKAKDILLKTKCNNLT